ncbi:MAG: hypothetical protein RL141_210 [Candidatus Parcubacteria bacterium]
MAKKKRIVSAEGAVSGLISKLEQVRSSKVIVYVTGDKQPPERFSTVIAPDILPFFRKILEAGGRKNKITLAISSNGGLIETPWPLVNLIREYCKNFEVIVLERALSAGTMISLGADRIVMFPYSYLSPIDPARNIMNADPMRVERIEIEDIIGYIDFVKEKVGLTEQNALAEGFKELTKEAKPSLLGSINRTHSLIRRLGRLLLEVHAIKVPEKQVKEIVENLTQKLYSHGHFINRREAREMIGFDKLIEYGNLATKKASENIMNFCGDLMELNQPFDPEEKLAGDSQKVFSLHRACVLSNGVSFTFTSDYQLLGIPDPSGVKQYTLNEIKSVWKKYE